MKRQRFKNDTQFHRYLHREGRSEKDVLDEAKVRLLNVRLEEAAAKSAPKPSGDEVQRLLEADPSLSRAEASAELAQLKGQEAREAFSLSFYEKWRSRTHCAPENVIERCANAKARSISLANHALCLEEDLVGQRPDACAAPVLPTAPALPGTVEILEPHGDQLQQGPRPIASEGTAG